MAFLALLVCLGLWQAGGVRHFVQESVYPFQNAWRWTARHGVGRAKAALTAARHAGEIETLAAEAGRLRVLAALGEAVDAENMRLRDALAFARRPGLQVLAAPVLAGGGTLEVWRTLRIGKGQRDGVRTGDIVMAPDGLVGRVADVSAHTAEVMLVTDPSCRVACEIQPPPEGFDAVRGIVFGGGGRLAGEGTLAMLFTVDPLRMRYLARDVEIPPRTAVVTSGLGHVFPAGLRVGWLLDSHVGETGLYREADVVPAVDLVGLSVVYVISASPEGGR